MWLSEQAQKIHDDAKNIQVYGSNYRSLKSRPKTIFIDPLSSPTTPIPHTLFPLKAPVGIKKSIMSKETQQRFTQKHSIFWTT